MSARLILISFILLSGVVPGTIARAQMDPSTALLLRAPDSVWPNSIEDLDPEIYLVRGRATRKSLEEESPAQPPPTERPSP